METERVVLLSEKSEMPLRTLLYSQFSYSRFSVTTNILQNPLRVTNRWVHCSFNRRTQNSDERTQLSLKYV